MQNFMEIGPVVFAGEYLGIKIGCSSYNTTKPVYRIWFSSNRVTNMHAVCPFDPLLYYVQLAIGQNAPLTNLIF